MFNFHDCKRFQLSLRGSYEVAFRTWRVDWFAQYCSDLENTWKLRSFPIIPLIPGVNTNNSHKNALFNALTNPFILPSSFPPIRSKMLFSESESRILAPPYSIGTEEGCGNVFIHGEANSLYFDFIDSHDRSIFRKERFLYKEITRR